MLLLGGVDSYLEEFFPIMQAMASAGYRVIGFEAPAGAASAFNNVFLPRRTHALAADGSELAGIIIRYHQRRPRPS
jgi:hypothetical protein